jgi:hypothetical protein
MMPGKTGCDRMVIINLSHSYMKKLFLPVLIIVLGITLSGCAKKTDTTGTDTSSDTSSTASGKKACEILTKEIADQILQTNTKAGDSNSDTTCTYSTDSDDLSELGVLTIVVTQSTSVGARESFEAAKSAAYGSNTEAVSGLNVDDAYWAPSLSQLSILDGSRWIIISGMSSKTEDTKTMCIETAKLAIENF